MPRYLLIHEGQHIHLPDGETLLGRGLRCRIRFNDPAISREHIRIDVKAGRAVVSNLGSNGTLVNGERLVEPRQLAAGDELRVGFRRMVVAVEEDAAPPDPARASRQRAPVTEGADEATIPGEEDAWRRRRDLVVLAELQEDHEPSSRATLDVPHRAMEKVVHRSEPRYPIEVPVIYSSETLTIDAMVRDISRGGMFIETELLDPIGTRCEVTALPDGHAALRFSGLVIHVSDDMTRAATTSVSGLGIRFTSGSDDAMRWLDSILTRFERAAVE